MISFYNIDRSWEVQQESKGNHVHKPLLFFAAITWAIFIFILWAAFDKNPFIVVGLGIIPVGLFVSGTVMLMKRAI